MWCWNLLSDSPQKRSAIYAIFMFLNFVTITIITPHPRGAQKPVGNDAGCKFKNVTFIIWQGQRVLQKVLVCKNVFTTLFWQQIRTNFKNSF